MVDANQLTGDNWQLAVVRGERLEGLLAMGYWLLAMGYWLLAMGYWLLAIGYWILEILSNNICARTTPRAQRREGQLTVVIGERRKARGERL